MIENRNRFDNSFGGQQQQQQKQRPSLKKINGWLDGWWYWKLEFQIKWICKEKQTFHSCWFGSAKIEKWLTNIESNGDWDREKKTKMRKKWNQSIGQSTELKIKFIPIASTSSSSSWTSETAAAAEKKLTKF